MASPTRDVIHRGDSVVSVEFLPDYPDLVVTKRPSKRHASRRSNRSLEHEYEMTRSLDAVEGVRQVIDQRSIEDQQALILEYIDGQTLRLEGSAEAQYAEWRRMLAQIFAAETGLSTDPDPGVRLETADVSEN